MLTSVVNNIRKCWAKLLLADIIFKALAFILLAPIVSLIFRAFIAATGKSVLADADIAKFLLHPIGMVGGLTVASLSISIFAIELSILMTLAIAAQAGKTVSIRGTLRFAATRNLWAVLRLALRVVTELILWALPFLAAGGMFYWLLLTDHDINYYLATKPPKFWIAFACIGVCLALLAGVLIWRLSNYIFATQILFFEGLSPVQAMQTSRDRASGHRLKIALGLCQWAAVNFLIGLAIAFIIASLGQMVILAASKSLWALVLAVGSTLGLAAIGNLFSSTLANATLSSLLGLAYLELGRPNDKQVSLPNIERCELLAGVRVTPLRATLGLTIFALAAAIFGGAVITSFNLNDNVVITAHRGGAIRAPENTLAAVEQAIEDRADWIEIDVQESHDGVVLVVHDSDLKKLGGPATKIWEATAAELQSIDIGSYHGAQFSDQRVPTLDDVLKLSKDRVKVNIELKYYGHTQDLEAKVVEIVEANEMQRDIVIMSLKQEGLAKIKNLRPEWTCGLLTAVATGDLTKVDADFLAVNAAIATRQFVDRAHNRGKDVAAWTLNDSYSLSLMISRGVDNLITDDPALARQVLAERSAMGPTDRLLLELAFYFGVKPKSFDQ